MQPSPAQRWRQVVKDHGLAAALGLGTFPRIIDDEGIEVGGRTECPLRETAGGEPQSLARQPLEVSMLAHVHDDMGREHLTQPQVLGQVGVGGGQIGTVVAEARISVVTAFRLDQHHDGAVAHASHRKGPFTVVLEDQTAVVVRRAPHGLQPLPPCGGQRLVPLPVDGQWNPGESWPVLTFRIVAAASQQHLDQCIAIPRQCPGKAIASLLEPGEHRGCGRRSIQPDTIGQATVAGGVVGQNQGHPPLPGRGSPQQDPVGRQGAHPGKALRIRPIAMQGRAQLDCGTDTLLEGSDPGGDAPVQFGQSDLHGQVGGGKSDAAGAPVLAGLAAAQQLQDGDIQGVPEGSAQARLLKLNGGKGRATDHQVHSFSRQQVLHPPLHSRAAQSTHPESPRTQSPLPQFGQQLQHQLVITGLPQGAVGDHTNPSAWIRAPVMGLGIGEGLRDRKGRRLAPPQGGQGTEQDARIGGSADPHAASQANRQSWFSRAQCRQGPFVLSRAGQHQQLAGRVSLGPLLQAVQAIAPVPLPAE